MGKNTISLLSDNSKLKYSLRGVIWRIVYLGFSYFFIFISELTFLSLVTQLYDQMDYKYLGNISVFIIYTFFGLGNFISSYVAEKFNIKWIQFICSLILTGFISMGILVSSCSSLDDADDYFICKKPLIYTLVILVTAIAGVTSAILWSAQSGFMMFYCKLYQEQEGKLIGIFWGIFQLSQGLGSLGAFVLLKYFSETIFLVIMTGIAGFGAFLLFFYENVPIHLMKQEFKISITSQGSHALSETTRRKIKEFKRLFLSADMRPYFSLFFMNGVVIAFYSSYMYTIIQSTLGYSDDSSQLTEEQKQDVNVKTTYVFTVLGFSEILAATICGKLMDKIHFNKVGYFSNVIVQLGIIFSFAAYFLNSYGLCFVCGFLWGFVDCFQVSVSSYICQVKFNGQIESFSIFRLFQGLGVMVTVLISIFMGNLDQYFFIFVILCFQIISSTFMLSQFKENPQSNDVVIKDQSFFECQQLDMKGSNLHQQNKQVPS